MVVLDHGKYGLLEAQFPAEDLLIVVGAHALHALALAILAVVSNHNHVLLGTEALPCLVLALLAVKFGGQIASVRIVLESSSLHRRLQVNRLVLCRPSRVLVCPAALPRDLVWLRVPSRVRLCLHAFRHY